MEGGEKRRSKTARAGGLQGRLQGLLQGSAKENGREGAISMYGLVVRFELRHGHEAAFDALVDETLGVVERAEPGTLLYVVHRVEGSPSSRVFVELYGDEAAFEAHEHSPHVRRFLRERAAHLASEPKLWRVTPGPGGRARRASRALALRLLLRRLAVDLAFEARNAHAPLPTGLEHPG
jgi:quinol monooxygenase YgiN